MAPRMVTVDGRAASESTLKPRSGVFVVSMATGTCFSASCSNTTCMLAGLIDTSSRPSGRSIMSAWKKTSPRVVLRRSILTGSSSSRWKRLMTRREPLTVMRS